MRVIKGFINLILMLVLGISLFLWMGYGLVEDTMLSFEANKTLLETTTFTEEITDELLDQYYTSLDELNFEKDVILQFVTESGEGVLGYVFSEYDTMPSVNVEFLKEYVNEQIEEAAQYEMDGQVNMSDLITVLRAVPEGNSVSSAIKSFTKDAGLNIKNSDIDTVSNVFIENKELEDEALASKLIQSIAVEKLNLNEMATEISLQDLFDQLMTRNPFTVLKQVFDVINKDMKGYLPLAMILIIILIAVIEFRVTSTTIWYALALLIAIIPLQLLRIADFFIQNDMIDLFGGLASYKTFMLEAMNTKLNFYSIVVVVLIIVLFVISRVFSNKVDEKIESAEHNHKRMVLIRLVVTAVLVFGLYMNVTKAIDYNMALVDDLSTIEASDFDPRSLDDTLSNLLNIEYDF